MQKNRAKRKEESQTLLRSWFYTLLFQKQERKVQGEEENQQEEVCEEMQGSTQGNSQNADTATFADYEKAEPDTCWVLSLLWDN